METAIVVTFITGAFTLLGGILIVLIKKGFDFLSLKKEIEETKTFFEANRDGCNSNMQILKEHFVSSKSVHEVEKNVRKDMVKQLNDIVTSLSQLNIKEKLDSKDYERMVQSIERIERVLSVNKGQN